MSLKFIGRHPTNALPNGNKVRMYVRGPLDDAAMEKIATYCRNNSIYDDAALDAHINAGASGPMEAFFFRRMFDIIAHTEIG